MSAPDRKRTVTERLSRLPSDDAYWDGLAERVSRHAAPLIAEPGREPAGSGRIGWLTWVEGSAARLAAAALAAAALAWLFLPPPPHLAEGARPAESVVARALAPDDPLVPGIASETGAPILARLVVPAAGGVER